MTLISLDSVRRVLRRLLVASAALCAGCGPETSVEQTGPQTRTDLLRRHYPDLESGRFAVVADFEEQTQLELFHLGGVAAGGGDIERSADGVEATGGHCLTVQFRSADSELVADNSNARAWVLKRDWRPYTLLLMNVHCPIAGIELEFELVSGPESQPSRSVAQWVLQAGWNALRLDLGDVAHRVVLDDIRELRWSAPGAGQPVALRIDDVLLADNRTTVFGALDGPDGALYVQREGRRINVGSTGRFELAFAHGQIVGCFALDSDPARMNNLVADDSALGPMVVRLPADGPGDSDSQWQWLLGDAPTAELLAVQQRVLEFNTVRVIVECVWSRPAPEGARDRMNLARWLYVIYPTGQVYVTLAWNSAGTSVSAEEIGLAVTRRMQGEPRVELHAPGQLGDVPDLARRSYACVAEGGASLFFMLHDGACGPTLQPVPGGNGARLNLVAYGGGPACVGKAWSALLGVGPAGDCDKSAIVARARAYGAMDALEVVIGALNRDSAGDLDQDGFNERLGAYMLTTESRRTQVKIRGASWPVDGPVFAVQAALEEEAWVYVNHVIHQPVVRDAHGAVLFQIPERVERDMIVEVYLRQR